MKRLFGALFAALLFVAIPSKAQYVDNPLHWNIRAGMNFSNYLNTPSAFDASIKPGAYFGVGAEYLITPNFFMEAGLDISLKGSSVKLDIPVGEMKERTKRKFNPVYLQVPIHAGYKFYLSNGFKLNLSAGPYLAYGLGGKSKMNGEKKSIFGSGGSDFKRFDFGLGVKAGLDIDVFTVHLGYDYGLVKMDNIYEAKNGNLYIGVGLKF